MPTIRKLSEAIGFIISAGFVLLPDRTQQWILFKPRRSPGRK